MYKLLTLLLCATYIFDLSLRKLTQHNDHRSIVMQHFNSALPAFVGLLMEHMTNPVMYHNIVYHFTSIGRFVPIMK